jgi:ArsR family transcriptional regulator
MKKYNQIGTAPARSGRYAFQRQPEPDPEEAAIEAARASGASGWVGQVHGWFHALSDPTRTRLLLVLERHELSVGELCEALSLPQSTVSRHLRVLLQDGWVATRAEGTSRYYRLGQLEEAAGRLWRAVRPELETSPDVEQDEAQALRAIELRRTALEQVFIGLTATWDAERLRLFGPEVELRALPALLDPGWTVADLGCGTGIVAEALAPHVARVIGVDASPFQLKEAQRRLRHAGNVELREARLESMPLADESVDAALMMLVLHYVPEPRQALAEAARILRPGGRLLLVEMLSHGREEYRLRLGHVWQGFTEEQVRGWLEETGLGDVRFHQLPAARGAEGPPLFSAVAVKAVTNGKATERRAR